MKDDKKTFKKTVRNYRKYMVLAMSLVMAMLIWGDFSQFNKVDSTIKTAVQVERRERTPEVSDKLLLNGELVAFCENVDIQTLKEDVSKELEKRLGYNYDEEVPLDIQKKVEKRGRILSKYELVQKASDMVYNSIDKFKKQAYLMKIGDDFVVALNTEEELKEALDYAKSKYLDADGATTISLVKDERNPLVLSPVLKLNRKVEEKNLVSSTRNGGNAEVADKIKQKQIVEAHFATDILVVKAHVYEDEIKDLTTAKQLITKENEKEKKYVVKSGDYPETIAKKNDMATEKLYQLNPGLKNRDKAIQVGEELTVMVPQPELSVAVTEVLVYEEPIEFGVSYEKDDNKLVGTEEVKFAGEAGVKKITVNIRKVNGKEVERKVAKEEVIKEPKNKIILKGSKPKPKPVPVKKKTKAKSVKRSSGGGRVTGRFSRPLSRYVVTSPFGARRRYGYHKGIDLAAPIGTPVKAADGGVVISAGRRRSFGKLVTIDHGNGLISMYAHNSSILVRVGQKVSKGQLIAKVGNTGRSTGPHLHFEVRVYGRSVNPSRYVRF